VKQVYAYFAYYVEADVAEELTATTFERVVRFWDSYDPERGLVRSWILTTARHVLADHFRRRKHDGTVSSLDAEPHLLEARASTRDPLAVRMSVETLKHWLTLLNPRQMEIVALRYGADLTPREIGVALELSEANVHQILSRALRLLREELSAERPVHIAEHAEPGADQDPRGASRLAPPQGAADV
jgi:RNA polymerase sigma factor (sigma-70 family)